MNNDCKPWQKEDGKMLSSQELIDLTQNWGGEGWEEFLVATVEKPLKESLLDGPHEIGHISEDYRTAYQGMLSSGDFPHLKAVIRVVLKHLSLREQRVVYGVFWEEKSLRNIAQEMRISKNTVATLKARSLEKLGRYLLENITTNINQSNSYTNSCDRVQGHQCL